MIFISKGQFIQFYLKLRINGNNNYCVMRRLKLTATLIMESGELMELNYLKLMHCYFEKREMLMQCH